MASIGVSNKIKRIVNKHLTNIPGGIIEMTDDASLIDDLNADSLDSIEIVMAIEDEFDILITDDEAERATTIGAIAALVEEKVKYINTIAYRGAPSG